MSKKASATLMKLSESGQTYTVAELAQLWNVHPDTIRRWEKKGHLKCVRHPINNYRLFLATDLNNEVDVKGK